MTRIQIARWTALLALFLLAAPAQAADGPREVPGENSVFAGYGVAMAWAVLRGSGEENTLVVVRILRLSGAYDHLRIDGVDPFTGARKEMLAPQPLGKGLDVRSPRASFAEFTRREIHFYTAEDWTAGRSSLVISYGGVPDTSPEFASAAALSAYLDDVLTNVGDRTQGRQP